MNTNLNNILTNMKKTIQPIDEGNKNHNNEIIISHKNKIIKKEEKKEIKTNKKDIEEKTK